MAQRIGKFEIRRLLGKGAQSSVYLAYDPQLEREVAIKTLRFAHKSAAQNQSLLNEARTVSKLRHANIVPIFEAGEQDGDPYLVFEYIEGRTLADLIRKERLEPARAVELMIGILDAVAYAHRFGVIHRDLKPSNVLINAEGLPRVMDFGIAARVAESGSGEEELQGTPAYMAPEYIARKVVSPQTDVFSAGLVFYEMVFGRRAVQAENVFQAMNQIANKPIEFPPNAGDRVDEKLHDLIAKAVAQDPAMRFQSAEQMRDELQRYLKPTLQEATGEEDAKGKASTLEFLLRRMRHKSDFPAMSAAIGAINRLAGSDKGNVNVLSNSILKDFALTNKILRVANSALYRQFGGGSISTVSRAIVVLGFNAVRNIALSLMLFEHLQHRQQAEQLREEFLNASMGGILGKQLSPAFSVREPEESFICAMFHGLGRLLAHFYFPEEADTITKLAAKESCSEDVAAARVLGISYEDLGIGIAESWGFPQAIVRSMKRLPPGKVPTAVTPEERLRNLSTFSNEVCAVIQAQPARDRVREITRLQKRYGENVRLDEKQLASVLQRSTEEVSELARAIGMNLKQSRLGKQLITPEVEALAAEGAKGAQAERLPATVVLSGSFAGTGAGTGNGSAAAAAGTAASTPSTTAANGDAAPASADVQAVLAAGIQDISQALVEDMSLSDLLRIVLETMYRAMGFKRVLLCMRDGRTGVMSARFGFGPDLDEVVPRFRFTLGGNTDIFNIILAKDKDVLITDASDAKIARYIPEWYKRDFSAKTFIIFPLRIKSAPVAMVYAEKDHPGSISLSDKELSLLRTLCNQSVLAIKQSADRG